MEAERKTEIVTTDEEESRNISEKYRPKKEELSFMCMCVCACREIVSCLLDILFICF